MAYKKNEIDEIFNYVCKEIESGKTLRNILKEDKMPSSRTFFAWLDLYPDKVKQYARATELRAEAIFDDILSIADQNENDTYINDFGLEVVNNDVIQRSRLRIDARKWVLSKLNPKKFGDKTDVTSGGEKLQTIQSIQVEILKPNED